DRLHAPLRHAAPRRHAQRDLAAARSHDAADASAVAGGGARMTMSFAQEAGFIIAAYAVTAFVVAALIAWVVLDHSAQRRILGDLEEQGVTRRSRRSSEI